MSAGKVGVVTDAKTLASIFFYSGPIPKKHTGQDHPLKGLILTMDLSMISLILGITSGSYNYQN